MTTLEILKKAKKASLSQILSTEQKNNALSAMATALLSNADTILEANIIDVLNAQGKISEVMIDRLRHFRHGKGYRTGA